MRRKSWLTLGFFLLFFVPGALLLFLHAKHDQLPLFPERKGGSWSLEFTVSGEQRLGANRSEIRFVLPQEDPYWDVVDENFASSHYSLAVLEEDGVRLATLFRRGSGQEPFSFSYRLQVSSRNPKSGERFQNKKEKKEESLPKEAMDAFAELFAEHCEEKASAACLQTLVNAIVFEHLDQYLRWLTAGDLQSGSFVRGVERLFQDVGIPGKTMYGVPLLEARYAIQLRPILMLGIGEQEVYVLDFTSLKVSPRAKYFVWSKRHSLIQRTSGVELEQIRLSLAPSLLPPSALLARKRNRGGDFLGGLLNLYRLPPATQALYGTLLLLPVAGLLVAILRNLIGLRPFGTFMPALLALALLKTGLWSGMFLFLIVILVGLIGRSLFASMNLLLVPRLNAVLGLVVLLMVGVSAVSFEFAWSPGLTVSLFPVVVLAMMIERMQIVLEESGVGETALRTFNTFIAALLSYLIISKPEVQYFVFAFPEAIFIFLALTVLLGRYTGYRLNELYRFREFAR